MIRFLSLVAAAGMALAATSADAKACRDAAGHFAACPTHAAPAPEKGVCRDAAGHFAKCGAPAATAAAPPQRNGGQLGMARSAPAATSAARPASATAPAGSPTARCKDGSLSYSKHRSGTCAGHHGVATWM